MNYYAIQARTRSENKYIKLFKSRHPEINLPIYFPQRELTVSKKGKLKKSLHAIFPGYIFIEAEYKEDVLSKQVFFKEIEGFFRFLKSNQDITPLSGHSLDIVLHFIKRTGQIAGSSKVYFDENSRIVVLEGPLKGLEGKIIKVDKRKGRAKISLDLYSDSFSIDLAFEVIEPVK
ncbi:transcription antitermination protein NusG [Treponema sp. R8-4-B8]